MTYYHISILWSKVYHYEKDRDEGAVRVISEHYNAGKKFLFDGRWVSAVDIEAIHIFATDLPSNDYQLSVFSLHKNEATRLWIHKPPQEAVDNKNKQPLEASSKNVFIVHGRDHEPMKELKTMLYEFGLDPIVLHEQASGGLTLAEKLERYAGKVGFTFVILTPDDVGGQKEDIRKKLGADLPFLQRPVVLLGPSVVDNILKNFEPRARQNVIFEMGYFWGMLERKRVCCLLKGNVEKPSDIEGIVYIPFKESVEEIRFKVMKELKEAGYEIKI